MLKLRYGMWQTEWQGISLGQIAQEKQMKTREIASADFYASFYNKLKQNHYHFQENWLNDKKAYADWLRKLVDKLAEDMQVKNPKILSVGCGIGIVEEPFIIEGYDVELQECQEESFDYLKNTRGIQHKTWVTSTLEELPSETYDIVWTNSVMYSFNDQEYKKLCFNISRILKPNGKFIIVDSAASWKSFLYENIVNVLWLLKKNEREGVFWGYVRSINEHERLLKEFLNVNKKIWIARTENGNYKDCNPVTLFGFYLKHYKNANIVFEGLICDKFGA